MANANSTRGKSVAKSFPLYFHRGSGHWCKTYQGRRYYFGKVKAEAYAKWKREHDDLAAGRGRRGSGSVVTVRYVVNYLLTAKKREVESGDISSRQFEDLKTMSRFVVEYFGENRTVESLRPDDFGQLRAKMAKRWAVSGLVARINNIRQFFNYAAKNGILTKPVAFGTQFSAPKKKVKRKARRERGSRMFRPDELRAMLDAASEHMRAFILLGVNAGVGNTDIALMENKHVDLTNAWLDYPRRKTEVDRRVKLWDETVQAIRAAKRNQPRKKDMARYMFLTKYGHLWSDPDSPDCAISKAFTKLAKSVEVDGALVYQRGKTFYSLRHVFETVAGGTKDQVAVDS